MHNLAVRLTIAAVLLAAGLAAGYVAQRLQHRAGELLAAERDVTGRLNQLIGTVNEIGAAERAGVAPGQPDQPWSRRVSELLQQLDAGATAIEPRLQSPDAAIALQTFGGGLESFRKIDARIREHQELDQERAAADLIFTDGRDSLAALAKTLQDVRRGEEGASDVARASLSRQSWTILGSAAALWTLGLILLAVSAGPAAASPAAETTASTLPSPSVSLESTPANPSVDLAAAADICTELSRLTTAAALPNLLTRAAVVLDATGIIVWMGAGEELFPVAVHGYDSRVVTHLGPIGRDANNATAAAWRKGELSTVRSDLISHGAVVAPMFGTEGCVGVLAAEVRHGREEDTTTRAVTAMIAAQIATAVSGWPVGSVKPAAEDESAGRGGAFTASVGG